MTRDAKKQAERYDLHALRERMLAETGGEVDDSIPELASANPDVCGLAIVDDDGDVRDTPDADLEFSVQSAVKPFVYALALVDDRERVLDAVGTEPTGEAFDAVRLESDTGRPPNPMVNAGALLTANLVSGSTPDERFERILSGLSAFAGRDLRVDDAVSSSEQLLGDRNRALGYLMRSRGTLDHPVDDAISVYARACSIVVSAEVLAVMGATLAFGGRNPVTGAQVVPREIVPIVLSVMATCGMYDGSGRWMRRVGLPAKSGVAGGLFASVPWQLGLGVYSPPLDKKGNSVRGVFACERLSDDMGLHVFGAPAATSGYR
ncbi:L-glutaminase [Rhodoglobus vestalii]|uniref:Glutaminase n=1 Tax=Rhodoglobus vestalii TaxID=193384 RepID=A0A8H2PX01_9MICO|nr:glutaminase A [Rhodoglobus vestalii]TQO18849.1 L-glutaminase [Rhodoglobus vestalii]